MADLALATLAAAVLGFYAGLLVGMVVVLHAHAAEPAPTPDPSQDPAP